MCSLCRDNFYNGNNPYSVKECWSYSSAEVVKRYLIPVDLRPPYCFPPQWVFSCYKRDRYATVKPEALAPDGFWKA